MFEIWNKNKIRIAENIPNASPAARKNIYCAP